MCERVVRLALVVKVGGGAGPVKTGKTTWEVVTPSSSFARKSAVHGEMLVRAFVAKQSRYERQTDQAIK